MRFLLIAMSFFVARISSTPMDGRRPKRDTVIVEDEEVTTQATFKVERLDTPIERIEIRLIDEHEHGGDNSTMEGNRMGVVPELTETQTTPTNEVIITKNTESGVLVNVVEENTTNHETSRDSSDIYNEKYKKVEYVSDANIPVEAASEVEEATTPTPAERGEEADSDMVNVQEPRPEQSQVNDSAVQSTNQEDRSEQPAPNQDFDQYEGSPAPRGELQAKAWLSFSGRMPKGEMFDADIGDIGELPAEIEGNPSTDDEPEPVEECLAEKDKLPRDVVDRLTHQQQKLYRMITKLNKQQKQYCLEDRKAEYRLCPIWREEKMVHNYKLMRITYCADYNRWPNATRVKRAYAQYLPLFETLYAFQKSENS